MKRSVSQLDISTSIFQKSIKGLGEETGTSPSVPGLLFSGVLCFLVHPGAVVLNADKARLGPASVRQLVQFDFR